MILKPQFTCRYHISFVPVVSVFVFVLVLVIILVFICKFCFLLSTNSFPEETNKSFSSIESVRSGSYYEGNDLSYSFHDHFPLLNPLLELYHLNHNIGISKSSQYRYTCTIPFSLLVIYMYIYIYIYILAQPGARHFISLTRIVYSWNF